MDFGRLGASRVGTQDKEEGVSAQIIEELNVPEEKKLGQSKSTIINVAEEDGRVAVRKDSSDPTDPVRQVRRECFDDAVPPPGDDDVDSIGHRASANAGSVDDEPETARPAWVPSEASNPSTGSHPPSNLRRAAQDPLQNPTDRVTEATLPPGSRKSRHNNGGGSGSGSGSGDEAGGLPGPASNSCGELEDAVVRQRRRGKSRVPERACYVSSSSSSSSFSFSSFASSSVSSLSSFTQKNGVGGGDGFPRQPQTLREKSAEASADVGTEDRERNSAPAPGSVAAAVPLTAAGGAGESSTPTTPSATPRGGLPPRSPAYKGRRWSTSEAASPAAAKGAAVSSAPPTTTWSQSSSSGDSASAGQAGARRFSRDGDGVGAESPRDSPRVNPQFLTCTAGFRLTNGEDPAVAPAAADSATSEQRGGRARERQGRETRRGADDLMASSLIKPILLPGRRGYRSKRAYKLGTPRERRNARSSANTEEKAGGRGGPRRDQKNSPPRSDKGEATKRWPELCARGLLTEEARVQSNRRGFSKRLSGSCSWDDSSSILSLSPMFSPGRFNPSSGALSRGESFDDSWCDGTSVCSFVTFTCNSPSASVLSSRGSSIRKLAPVQQLSAIERQEVERLRIERSDISYLTVNGSRRVYKIVLDGEIRAAKVFSTLGMSKEEVAEVRNAFDSEVLALSRIDSPYVVKVRGGSVSPAEIILVSEFVEGDVLRRVLHDPRTLENLTHRIRLGIAMDVASGMRTLYSHGIQHRRLSSNSILLTNDYRAKIVVRPTLTTELIGFFTGEGERTGKELQEDLPWESREVLAGAGFSEKSDVYSFGVVLWEVMQKEPSLPFADLPPREVIEAKYNGVGPPIPSDCPPQVAGLMEKCWSTLPGNRPSFDTICKTLESARESGLRLDGGGAPTSGATDATSSATFIPTSLSEDKLVAVQPSALSPAPSPAPSAAAAAGEDQDRYPDPVVKPSLFRRASKVSDTEVGESSNSLNDRTTSRIDAAIKAALAIHSAGASSRGPGETMPGSRGPGKVSGGLPVPNIFDRQPVLSLVPAVEAPPVGARIPRSKAMEERPKVTEERSKAITEARIDAAIRAALRIHAASGSGDSSGLMLQGSTEEGEGAASAARRVFRPRGLPSGSDSQPDSQENINGAGDYGGTDGGAAVVRQAARRVLRDDTAPPTETSRASGGARKSGASATNGFSTTFRKVFTSLPFPRAAKAHEAEERRVNFIARRLGDARARGRARAQAEKRGWTETTARERAPQDVAARSALPAEAEVQDAATFA